jgi:serine/threonine kinase 16
MHTYRTSKPSPNPSTSRKPPPGPGSDDGHDENEMFPHPEGDAEGGYSYGAGPRALSSANVPLVSRQDLDDGDVIFDGDPDTVQDGTGELVPYAHRDLKPG